MARRSWRDGACATKTDKVTELAQQRWTTRWSWRDEDGRHDEDHCNEGYDTAYHGAEPIVTLNFMFSSEREKFINFFDLGGNTWIYWEKHVLQSAEVINLLKKTKNFSIISFYKIYHNQPIWSLFVEVFLTSIKWPMLYIFFFCTDPYLPSIDNDFMVCLLPNNGVNKIRILGKWQLRFINF